MTLMVRHTRSSLFAPLLNPPPRFAGGGGTVPSPFRKGGGLGRGLDIPRISNSRPRAEVLCAVIATIGIVLLAGCSSTVTVPVRVKVAAELDLRKHDRVAVIPFVDKENRLNAEQLEELTELLRQNLSRIPNFNVQPGLTTRELLESEDLNADTLRDPDHVRNWGGALNTPAVITGIVRYYSVTAPRQHYVERYSFQLQRYVTEVETYLARTHYLNVEFTVWDSETGTALLPFKRNRQVEETESVVGYVVREAMGTSSLLNRLIREPLRDFSRRIMPHYEYEERVLAR